MALFSLIYRVWGEMSPFPSADFLLLLVTLGLSLQDLQTLK